MVDPLFWVLDGLAAALSLVSVFFALLSHRRANRRVQLVEQRYAEVVALHVRLCEGCCPTCSGSGAAYDESTGGKCWDCQGTGHPHLGTCGPLPLKELSS